MNLIKGELLAKTVAVIFFGIISVDGVCQNEEINIWKDITYHEEDGLELKLNLYAPKITQDKSYLVVLLHGELMKNKEDFECLAINLASSGNNVVCIDYRTPPDYSYPKALNDVLTAIDWVGTNKQTYNISTASVGLVGQNFGGYLAMLIGIKYPEIIDGMVSIHAQTNLTNFYDGSGYSYMFHAFLGFPYVQNPDRWKEASPVHQVNKNTPPLLILHGKSDKYVPFSQAKEMEDAINSINGDIWLWASENVDNGSYISEEMCENTAEKISGFLKHSLSSLPNVEFEKNHVYASHKGQNLHLDIFKPKKVDGKLPAVIFVHGGGWVWGNKNDLWFEAAELASKGFITATVEYRLASEHIYPGAVDDIKAAVRWMRANANEIGIQPDRIGLVGRSSGGHLAGMLGVTPDKKYFEELIGPSEPSAEVQAVVMLSGAVDLTAVYPRDPWSPTVFLGFSQPEAPELYFNASPINLVGIKSAPFLFIHGTKDHLGSHDEVVNMAKKLQAHGVIGEVFSIENGGHDFERKEKWRDEAMDAMVDFFKKTLKKEIQN